MTTEHYRNELRNRAKELCALTREPDIFFSPGTVKGGGYWTLRIHAVGLPLCEATCSTLEEIPAAIADVVGSLRALLAERAIIDDASVSSQRRR